MMKRILITGGVELIGSHVTDESFANGYQARVLGTLPLKFTAREK